MSNVINLDRERFLRRGILIDDKVRANLDIFNRLLNDAPNIAVIYEKYGKWES